jgi:hypothetical protein
MGLLPPRVLAVVEQGEFKISNEEGCLFSRSTKIGIAR